jgi:hypothetical protein
MIDGLAACVYETPSTSDLRALGQSDVEGATAPHASPGLRIALEPDDVKKGLGKLILTVVELLRELLERQAMRRIEAGSLADTEIERLGTTFLQLAEQMEVVKTKVATPPVHECTRIQCAFCRGGGTDPFGVMSDRSVCGCCCGQGTVEVPAAHVRCSYCGGSGSHKTFRCLVCGGTGVVSAPEGPTKTCPACDGLACERSSGLVCLTCRGRGVLSA